MLKKSFLNKLRPIAIATAMSDMALLLLIFFMATTTTEQTRGKDVDLPVSVTRGAEQDNIYITITRQKEIIMDGKTVTLEELNNNLALRQSEKDRVIAIIADKNLNYAVISELLLVLQDQDFLNIIFMSQPRKEQKKP